MSGGKYVVDSIRSFDYMDKQLGRLRQWLEGFKQGGGHVPHDFDVLRQCQIALSSGKPLRTPDDARAALRGLTRAFDELDDGMDLARGKLAAVEALFAEAASVGRNAERQDHEDGLGPKDEHAVGSEADETPDLHGGIA